MKLWLEIRLVWFKNKMFWVKLRSFHFQIFLKNWFNGKMSVEKSLQLWDTALPFKKWRSFNRNHHSLRSENFTLSFYGLWLPIADAHRSSHYYQTTRSKQVLSIWPLNIYREALLINISESCKCSKGKSHTCFLKQKADASGPQWNGTLLP